MQNTLEKGTFYHIVKKLKQEKIQVNGKTHQRKIQKMGYHREGIYPAIILIDLLKCPILKNIFNPVKKDHP